MVHTPYAYVDRVNDIGTHQLFIPLLSPPLTTACCITIRYCSSYPSSGVMVKTTGGRTAVYLRSQPGWVCLSDSFGRLRLVCRSCFLSFISRFYTIPSRLDYVVYIMFVVHAVDKDFPPCLTGPRGTCSQSAVWRGAGAGGLVSDGDCSGCFGGGDRGRGRGCDVAVRGKRASDRVTQRKLKLHHSPSTRTAVGVRP